MKKREAYSRATFEAHVSRLVITRTKKQAIEKAAHELNASNLPLDRITLRNELGESKVFSVLQAERLDWYDAEATDSTHQFKAYGRIRLSICTAEGAIDHLDAIRSLYSLPRTSLYDKPVLVISEGLNHFFLTVLRQELNWEAAQFLGVAPISKLA
ncbi:hypothetical protein [Paenibacillus glycinis]|uniref:Uncharacterized protein n=1 Tax=Paenibacillus glycinis TaxID=2697035 RepID=A0ABW9XIU3_9BACL|nr:hypothetical protein [Paenibacillus glycinis]NBD22524.1 hypothetical protein [Paenibacillus glycinis]